MEQTGKLKEQIAQLLQERNSLLSDINCLKNQVEEVEKENAAQKETLSAKDELIVTLLKFPTFFKKLRDREK